MNPLYDAESASRALEQLANERAKDKLAGLQLADKGGDSLMDIAKVVSAGGGAATTKRLAHIQQDMNGVDEEVVWHLQGALTGVDLPPFTSNRRTKEKAKYLRQGVKVCGLETASFDRAVQTTKDILAMFSRSVNKIQPPTFIDTGELGVTVDAYNRYFSSRSDDRGGQQIEFGHDVDPSGALAKIGGGQYYHGEENKVSYFERVFNKSTGKKSLKAVSPVMFKPGDLVEVQITFMLVQVKGAEWKMVATLRCITLLNAKFAQECIRGSLDFGALGRPSQAGPGQSLKRRAGFDLDDEDEEDEAANKLKRINLGEDMVN